MEVDAAALEDEVRSLWQRKGVRGPWRRRPYPQLQRILRISEMDLPGQIVKKLGKMVERLMSDHPADRDILLTALGMRAEAPQSNLEQRLRSLAMERSKAGEPYVEDRTMKRRLKYAAELFVEAAVADARASSAAGAVGYEVEDFRAVLDLTGERTKSIVRRRIRVKQDRLEEIPCAFGLLQVPKEDDKPLFAIEVVAGGQRCDRIEWRGGTAHYYVTPRKPLELGQTHEFEVVHKLPPGFPISPHLVIQPDTPFREADLTVRFDPSQPPDRVWLVDGVTPREVDVCPSTDVILTLDLSAGIRVTFREIHAGRSYGIAWEGK